MSADATHESTRTVLIVDDYPAVLAWAARAFSRAGWTVLTASDGGEALRVWERANVVGNAPALLVTDLGLPDIDGPSLARSLRELDQQLFVIALTGYPERDAAWCGTLLDRTAFFQKPIMAATLIAAADALTQPSVQTGDDACPLDPLPRLSECDSRRVV